MELELPLLLLLQLDVATELHFGSIVCCIVVGVARKILTQLRQQLLLLLLL